jgi:hypothetical protein
MTRATTTNLFAGIDKTRIFAPKTPPPASSILHELRRRPSLLTVVMGECAKRASH